MQRDTTGEIFAAVSTCHRSAFYATAVYQHVIGCQSLACDVVVQVCAVLVLCCCTPGDLRAALIFCHLQPLPAESTIICTARVESCEGRKIWVTADITDPSRQTVYASSRALFVKPKAPVPNLMPVVPLPAAAAATNGDGHKN